VLANSVWDAITTITITIIIIIITTNIIIIIATTIISHALAPPHHRPPYPCAHTRTYNTVNGGPDSCGACVQKTVLV
jgi:hypothetical protein